MTETASPYSNPEAKCDLVMKGGVTSGVVFPPAVLQLARKYRLCCIGGASAGAIAASFTAAAEFARDNGGFERLEEVSNQLGKRRFIKQLFQPDRSTRPLFEALIGLSDTKGAGVVRLVSVLLYLTRITLRYFTGGYLLGLAVGVGLWFLNLWAVGGSLSSGRLILLFLFAGFFAWLMGVGLGVLGLSRILQRGVPDNFFGLCNGFSNRTGDHVVMTDWLYESIQKIAGRSREQPLTMGDLDREEITFRMVSSNLSQGRPYSLPFRDNTFLFKPREFAKLFPPEVVKWLVTHAHKPEDHAATDGLCYLPPAELLPAVVAVRMSLSFPLLISAVPLYTVRRTAWSKVRSSKEVTPDDVQDQWFSDGGISSNFPIHLFDAWISTRPTFGITLGEYPANPPDGLPRVKLPQPTEKPFSGVPLTTLWSFFNAIWNTAQNHRDNTQAALPSYYERVAQVLLTPDQGGLNLDMEPRVVKEMNGYGAEAGHKLCKEFNLPAHQWVRLQVLMEPLEEQVREFARVLDEQEIDLDQLIDAQQQGTSKEFPYRRESGRWCREAKARLEALRVLGQQWKEPVFSDRHAPASDATLRVNPDL